jgi:hypothetical protein
LGDQQAAHAVAHEVAVDLPREMGARVFEPLQDLQPAVIGHRLGHMQNRHIYNLPIP